MVKSSMQDTAKKIFDDLDLGYKLYDLTYKNVRGEMNLTLYIYKESGNITIDDCEIVHRAMDKALDKVDPTNGKPYRLNVSSIGLDRNLVSNEDFLRCKGKDVYVKLYSPISKIKEMVGMLNSYDENNIYLKVGDENISIPRKALAVCKLNIKV